MSFGAVLLLASTGVLLLALALHTACRRGPAVERHGVCTAGFLALLALPLLTTVLPQVPVRVLPALPAGAGPGGGSLPLWVIVWLAGALWGLARIAVALLRLELRRRRATAVVDPDWLALLATLAERAGLRRVPSLVMDPRATTAATWGVLRPVIALPGAAAWPQGRRQAVLIHELAHVRRRDAATLLVAQIACALFWMQPLVWLLRRRLRLDQEIAADDLALGVGAKASAYATHLLELVRGRHTGPEPCPAVAMSGAASHLEHRLGSVLARGRSRATRRAHGGVVLATAVVLALPWSALRLERVRAEPASSPGPATLVAAPRAAPVTEIEAVPARVTAHPTPGAAKATPNERRACRCARSGGRRSPRSWSWSLQLGTSGSASFSSGARRQSGSFRFSYSSSFSYSSVRLSR